MSTSIDYYATRESMVSAVRWTGGDAAYRLINQWSDGKIRLEAITDKLLLKDETGIESVPVGNYIVRVDDTFHSFAPEEMQEIYAKVTERNT